MPFTLADFQAAAQARYGGLVIEDAPGGRLTIQNAMAITQDDQRAALKAAIAKVNDLQGSEGEDSTGTDLDDLPALRDAVVDLLAALSDRPDSLRQYLAGQSLAVVVAVKDAWEESSSPKATS